MIRPADTRPPVYTDFDRRSPRDRHADIIREYRWMGMTRLDDASRRLEHRLSTPFMDAALVLFCVLIFAVMVGILVVRS